MEKFRSCDNTQIAFDVTGEGPALIIIDGALACRSQGNSQELIDLLAADFAVYGFDRRGTGQSGDSRSYSVVKEVGDIAKLIDIAGGQAFLYGHSSGAILALEAALKLGPKVPRLVVYEPPLNDDEDARANWAAYRKDLETLSASRNADAILVRFMRATRMSEEAIETSKATPQWATLRKMSKSLTYNAELFGSDGSIPLERYSQVEARSLFLGGEESWEYMCDTATKLAQALPDALAECIPGETHNPRASVLAPIIREFLLESVSILD